MTDEATRAGTQKAGTHGWAGQCSPEGMNAAWARQTFSVGVFQWIPKAGQRGLRGELKRSKVIVRVVGSSTNPRAVYDTAEMIRQRLDAGQHGWAKVVRV